MDNEVKTRFRQQAYIEPVAKYVTLSFERK